MNNINELCKLMGIDEKVVAYVEQLESTLGSRFKEIDDMKFYNQMKVIKAMQEARLDATHFNWTTGYGYDDVGREKVEEIYAHLFKTEDALVRPTIVSGTHALSLTLSALTLPGDEILSVTGKPYDTLQKVIGITGNEPGNLSEYGIQYDEVPLDAAGHIQIEKAVAAVKNHTKLVIMQRSTGYSDRCALTIDELSMAIKALKKAHPEVLIMVDNCYGEFVEDREPSELGADVTVGSLIKNPGGGLAMTGGYIVGRKELIDRIANRSTAPGVGKECGLTFGTTRNTLQGLFLAPQVVANASKNALLYAHAYHQLGYKVIPSITDKRSDIIQAIEFNDPEMVIAFCKGIQSASPVDSYVTPLPWDMPGYEDQVIMAAGAFIQGSSIELSADAPMRAPYYVYMQGGLTYEHGKFSLMKTLAELSEKGKIHL